MRNSPLNVVDPASFGADDLSLLSRIAEDADDSGTLDLNALPEPVQDQLMFALHTLARGDVVAAISTNKPLSSTEAAKALGMSRTHLTRMCDEGRIESFVVGSHLRVPGEEIVRILRERAAAMIQSREAAATADDRRRQRAAHAAGLL